ncbi:MAG TPA: signal peptidase I [Polyangiaceae bacterium LLY-WYZ-14_1]|jgi:signal peptidase I|nr:signal peptidase I [Polyangiaceae bacterium LLY-WYZ-14_1]
MGWIKGLLKAALWLGLPLVAIAGVLQFFFVDRMVLGHDAMAPTIFAGDTIFVWRNAEPRFGRIMVCDHPQRAGVLVIGRVVGVKGRTIDAFRGNLQIEGDTPSKDVEGRLTWVDPETGGRRPVIYGTLSMGNVDHRFFEEPEGIRLRPTKVREGVYVLGDNRAARGQDSRYFGTVTSCRGRVILRASTAELVPPDLPSRSFLEIL